MINEIHALNLWRVVHWERSLFFFQAEDGIRDVAVTGVQTCALPISTCIVAADTFGADGKVVLLERGTKLVGETRGQVQQGQARVFVLWTEARTPSGVKIGRASCRERV